MPAHNCASYLLPPPLFSGRENSNLSKELRESGFVNRSEVGKGKINDVSGRAGEGEEAARDCVKLLVITAQTIFSSQRCRRGEVLTYLRRIVKFQRRLLGDASEMCSNLLFIAFIIRVIKVIVMT